MALSFKQKLLALLTAILALCGLVFAFFLFSAPALRVTGDATNAQRIWIENPADHAVTNVRIEDLQGSVFQSIPLIASHEKKSVDLGTFNRGLPVLVESNFHPTARFEMDNAANTCPIGYHVVRAPSNVRRGEPFSILLNLCSHNDADLDLVLSETHSSNLGSVPAKANNMHLAKDQCKSAAFSFSASQDGMASVQILIDCGPTFARVPFSKIVEVNE
jgi:hypothetical protein